MKIIPNMVRKTIAKSIAKFGYQLQRTEVNFREILAEMGIPSLPLISLTHYHKICPSLFSKPQFIPNQQLKLIDNISLRQYFDITASSGGATIQDLTHRVYETRQRMFMTAYLTLQFPPMSKLSFLDLACSSGYFSFHADRLGFDHVLGVDARTEHRVQFTQLHEFLSISSKCRYQTLDLSTAAQFPEADVVLCTGLMYHLADHATFILKLRASTKKLLILDTDVNGRADDNNTFYFEDKSNLRNSINGVGCTPSLRSIINLLRWAGFSNIRHIEDPKDPREPLYLSGNRITLIAE